VIFTAYFQEVHVMTAEMHVEIHVVQYKRGPKGTHRTGFATPPSRGSRDNHADKMSSSTDATGVVLDCSNSALSTISSVMGILTFTAAIFALSVFFIGGLRDSEREMEAAFIKMRLRVADLTEFKLRLDKDAREIEDSYDRERLRLLIDEAQSAAAEAYKLENGPMRPYRSGTELPVLFHRARFVLQKEEIDKVREKLDKAMGDLRDAASDVFDQYMSRSSQG
jgi:hypothetical protein